MKVVEIDLHVPFLVYEIVLRAKEILFMAFIMSSLSTVSEGGGEFVLPVQEQHIVLKPYVPTSLRRRNTFRNA
jgi:hypothetical protein